MQLPQHWWSDRSEATLISTSLTSTHVRLVAVPSNSGIRKKTVKHLLSSDVYCSRFGFCSVVASICGKIVFGLRNADSRETQSKSHCICMRAWKWTMIHLLTWACEHIEPCYNCWLSFYSRYMHRNAEIARLDIDGRLRRGGHRSLVLLSSVQFRCCEQVFNFSRMTKTSPETEITQNCCRPTASDNAHATDQCKSHKYLRCCLLHAMQLRLIFTDHFSDRGKAIGQVYVYVCVFG